MSDTTEMIGQVARAIYYATKPKKGWDDRSEDYRRTYYEQARAAIEAMREPTDLMLAKDNLFAGFYHDADGVEDNYYLDREEVEKVYRAMFDAALRGE